MSIKLSQIWKKCDECNGDFIIDNGLETYINCGKTNRYFNTSIRSYSEAYHQKYYNYYVHITRFMKLLRIYQGRVLLSEISDTCWKSIIEKCRTPDQILHVLKLSPRIIKYYDYVNLISHIIFKTKLYVLPIEVENIILSSFKQVLAQCGPMFRHRKTYFPYPFIIKKLLLYHGYTNFENTVRQMECKRRIQHYNTLWEKITLDHS